MKSSVKTIVMLAAVLAASQSVQAADMGAKPMYTKAPVAAPAANWTGFYVGLGGGFGGYATDHTSTLGAGSFPQSSIGGSGGFGALQIGADYQFAGRWVAGVFGDFDFSSIKGTGTELISFLNIPLKQQYAFAAGARLGVLVIPQLLAYADGGYTRARFTGGNMTFIAPPSAPSIFDMPDQSYNGFFVGGGLEYAIYNGWSIKSEYRYAQYSSTSVTIPNATPVFTEILKPTVQTGRVSLVYKF